MNAARFTAGDRVTYSWRGVRGWRHEVPAVVIASWVTTARIKLLHLSQQTTRIVPTSALSVRLRHCHDLDSNNHQKEYAR